MVILLLANDTELNPGPRPVKYPCLVCSKPAKWGQSCLQCDSCDGWYHTECMDMPVQLYEHYANSNIAWICSSCGQSNVSPPAFNTLTGLPLSNSFSFLDTTVAHDQPHAAFEDSLQEDRASNSSFEEPNPPNHQSNAGKRRSHNPHNLKCIVVNCDGLYNKVPDLQVLIDKHKPDVIIGTESHLKSTILTPEITPPGFSTFRRDREESNKGGVFIMVKENLIATECNVISTEAEQLWIELHIQGHRPLVIGSFYRPPKSPATNLQELSSTLPDIKAKFKNAVIILAGDFNLADVDWENWCVKPYPIEGPKCSALLDICNDNFLDQMVTKPTRISGATKNILDLVLTTHPGFISNCSVSAGISDHEVADFCVNLKPRFNKKVP